MRKRPSTWRLWAGCFPAMLALATEWSPTLAAETNVVPQASAIRLEETNSLQTLQVLLQLEGQIRSNRLAAEQSGLEARDAASRNMETLSNGLHTIQNALSLQQATFSARSAQELETLQSSSRLTLMLGGTFTAIAALAMLIIAYFQWRMSKTWAGIAAVLPPAHDFVHGAAFQAVGAEEPHAVITGPAAESNRRLLGAVEKLEHRIQELEQRLVPALTHRAVAFGPGDNGDRPEPSTGSPNDPELEQSTPDDQARIALLLGQGKSLLNGSDWEGAVARFDEVLTLNPNHGEALVKKGAALERLQKLNEAFECYDRAIAADGTMAIAYLHKGGLFNRLERFKEALECYEKALKAHDDRHG